MARDRIWLKGVDCATRSDETGRQEGVFTHIRTHVEEHVSRLKHALEEILDGGLQAALPEPPGPPEIRVIDKEPQVVTAQPQPCVSAQPPQRHRPAKVTLPDVFDGPEQPSIETPIA